MRAQSASRLDDQNESPALALHLVNQQSRWLSCPSVQHPNQVTKLIERPATARPATKPDVTRSRSTGWPNRPARASQRSHVASWSNRRCAYHRATTPDQNSVDRQSSTAPLALREPATLHKSQSCHCDLS